MSALPEQLFIPAGVAQEIQAGSDDPARRWLSRNGRHYVHEIGTIPPLIAAWDLGRGETEVLAYALTHRDYSAVLDDRAARQCATCCRFPCVVRWEWHCWRGLIERFAPVLEALRTAGLRLSPQVAAQALHLANES
ncbi:MAG: DUF3368 domain-containing protein [Gammaproteobacteria bacterium]|nr:DUF3368 domain-containing protein [Gammaproteobacteria bacterium]